MANQDKVKTEQDATRIIHWLTEQRATFEHEGIDEATLAGSVGLAEEEVTRAVDHLENHETVVRFPHASATPPKVILKPGRGWIEVMKNEEVERQAANK